MRAAALEAHRRAKDSADIADLYLARDLYGALLEASPQLADERFLYASVLGGLRDA